MRYRFTLTQIDCAKQRSADQYRDALDVTFCVGRVLGDSNDFEIMSSILGLPGPRRYGPLFGPGTSVSLAPQPNSFGYGFDRPWTLEFDVPEDGSQIFVRVILNNHRGVDDPFKFSKTVLSLAAAAGTGAAGGALAIKAKELVGAALAGGLGGLAGEGVKKALGELFGEDWPECAGTVFVYDRSLSLADVQSITNATLSSSNVGYVDTDCGNPSYTVQMVVERLYEVIEIFAPSARVKKTVYKPFMSAKHKDWLGKWTSDSGANPNTTLTLSSTQLNPLVVLVEHVRERLGQRQGPYDASISERLEDGAKLYSGVSSVNLRVTTKQDIVYSGAVAVGVAKIVVSLDANSTANYVPQVLDPAVHFATKFDRVSVRAGVPSIGAVLNRYAGGQASLSLEPSVILPVATAGDPPSLQVAVNNFSQQYDLDISNLFPLEEVPVIDVPDREVTLSLYQRIDTMDDGKTHTSTVIRYVRWDTRSATRAEYELSRHGRPVA